jgi:hypothetical protein
MNSLRFSLLLAALALTVITAAITAFEVRFAQVRATWQPYTPPYEPRPPYGRPGRINPDASPIGGKS